MSRLKTVLKKNPVYTYSCISLNSKRIKNKIEIYENKDESGFGVFSVIYFVSRCVFHQLPHQCCLLISFHK